MNKTTRTTMMTRGLLTALLLAMLVGAAGCITRVPGTVQREGDVEYGRIDGQSLRLDLYTPRQPAGKLPVLVWIHGGSWKAGSKRFCPIAFMATQNLAVASINYRLVGAAAFPAQLHDCKGAIRWLRAHAEKYHLDTDHIGLFGVSAGGHLAALLGTTADRPELEGAVGGNLEFSSRVQAVCAFYPPTDLDKMVSDPKDRRNPKATVARLIGGVVQDSANKAAAASPVTYVTKESAPFFLFHGDQDTLVPVEQSKLFHQALRQAGVESRLEIALGQGHGAIPSSAVAEQIYRFFDQHLRGER